MKKLLALAAAALSLLFAGTAFADCDLQWGATIKEGDVVILKSVVNFYGLGATQFAKLNAHTEKTMKDLANQQGKGGNYSIELTDSGTCLSAPATVAYAGLKHPAVVKFAKDSAAGQTQLADESDAKIKGGKKHAFKD